MAYRGKPSKACQRCRERKLRCDLRKECSSCLRVGAQCSGYRDTEALRIADQTQSVQSKVLGRKAGKAKASPVVGPAFEHLHLPVDIGAQARGFFTACYIADLNRAWYFMVPHLQKGNLPEHLALCLDAVSLAFLHQRTQSTSARDLGFRKYANALRMTNCALQNTDPTQVSATLGASLLLDLFEKVMNPEASNHKAKRAHLDGALALVKVKGLDSFRTEADKRMLFRVVMNAVVTSMSRKDPVDPEIPRILTHVGTCGGTEDWSCPFEHLMFEMSDLVSGSSRGTLPTKESIQKCKELDRKFSELPVPGESKGTNFSDIRKRSPIGGETDAGYSNGKNLGRWVMTRSMMRILLCEEIVASSTGPHTNDADVETSRNTITDAIEDIGSFAMAIAGRGLSISNKIKIEPGREKPHILTVDHFVDLTFLVFGLCIAAWAPHCPQETRDWNLKHLGYIADYYGIRDAETFRQYLLKGGKKLSPWDVYSIMGDHSFVL
ncbi:hypothetical protein BS50DRAFT_621704 [Corynespora cassiicola Philippines]|uniref:Zn(2)-C6 fungal-type domain-containing protein n=1 Tax=Corynespora cassiicola Philippines TaxID=1448308 RepID=A0A2T2NKF2_CORCC|nr:hypothetical protein BS50DRAFT_621704 [Corynespora cassiicola Philippines]